MKDVSVEKRRDVLIRTVRLQTTSGINWSRKTNITCIIAKTAVVEKYIYIFFFNSKTATDDIAICWFVVHKINKADFYTCPHCAVIRIHVYFTNIFNALKINTCLIRDIAKFNCFVFIFFRLWTRRLFYCSLRSSHSSQTELTKIHQFSIDYKTEYVYTIA